MKLVFELLDNVCPDVDERPLDLRIPLRSWFLAFGCHRSLPRSHTTEITPSTAITVTVAAIVTSMFTAQ